MFGCLGRLGCLLLCAVLAVAGWYTKPMWYPRVRAMVVAAPPSPLLTWKPISPEAATRATRAADRLAETSGPVYADLTPAEFAAWQLGPAMRILGASAADPQATVHGDTLLVRVNVAVSDLGDPKQLGPLATMLDGRQPVLIGGRLSMARPGVLALQVTHMTVKELRLPSRLVEKIVQRISVKQRADTSVTGAVAPGVIALPVSRSIVDVRVANGKVVLYKAAP